MTGRIPDQISPHYTIRLQALSAKTVIYQLLNMLQRSVITSIRAVSIADSGFAGILRSSKVKEEKEENIVILKRSR